MASGSGDPVTGGCLCGKVRIAASGDPYRVGLCHCLDCRKNHGAMEDEVEVHLGTLDSPNAFRPTYEAWSVRREDWLPAFPEMRGYDGNREGTGRTEP